MLLLASALPVCNRVILLNFLSKVPIEFNSLSGLVRNKSGVSNETGRDTLFAQRGPWGGCYGR